MIQKCLTCLFSKQKEVTYLELGRDRKITNQCPVDFFSICVFFHKYSRFTGQQGKGEDISLTPFHHFHPLPRHLDISPVITPESSPLYIGSSRTRTGNLRFPSASG